MYEKFEFINELYTKIQFTNYKNFFNCEAILKIINAINKSYHSIIIDTISI